MSAFQTVQPSEEEIEQARRLFSGSDAAALRELCNDEELGDLLRTVTHAPNAEEAIGAHPFASDSRKAKFRIGWWLWSEGVRFRWHVEEAIEAHPFASDSRKAKFRIGWWLWNGDVRFRWHDPHTFDTANRARFIRAMRVYVGLTADPLPGEE